ncbi:MFS transporter [Paraflavitalea sp. CAU 1676]|uniref:MFS transporter n=1 Tax=Paraflavitalea sp. CAU 1676 TaxID=3032598 RepID=UPI0023DBCB01|nr:MFS transporter [Paraflavitalea sp. CAU 1676]MDF2187602.1 MFS transporter [Paraflavitalea sp. CAU 1676]
MNVRPKKSLSEGEVQAGLKLVVTEGLATEAMTTLIGGAFLVAMALLLGANNLQIGLLAALPTFTNIFQLLSIWLVQRYNNRRVISVTGSLLARLPLVVIGCLSFFASGSIQVLIFFLFFYYLFASIAGLSWNAWMKDLVPGNRLGAYFSRRSSYMQTLNVVLSLCLAFLIDYMKDHYPAYELATYSVMFITAGVIGIGGAFILVRVPEPESLLARENIFLLFKRPLQDANFRKLLMFNSAWVFALNIAIPFFTVYMLKHLGLSMTYVIGLTVVSQLCSILTIRMWGRFSDRYSNKTILAIAAPVYILCIIGWCFVGIYSKFLANMILLVLIHIFTGVATAGINLSLTNIGLKLAPNEHAIVYLSTKNIITAVFSSVAPLIGGILADYFADRSLVINAAWAGPKLNKVFHLVSLHDMNFLFLIGAGLAFFSLEFLLRVKEVGEVEKDIVVRIMRSSIKNNLKENFLIGNLISWHDQLWGLFKKKSH